MTFPSFQNQTIPNFPKPLDRNESQGTTTFPLDIINGYGRNFYTQIQFVDYSVAFQFNSAVPYAMPSGGIKLPIPLKLNETFVLEWSQISAMQALASGAQAGASLIPGVTQNAINNVTSLISIVGSGVGIAAGIALNPLLFLQFQRPQFKEYSLSWILTPRNEKESKAIKNIITQCKQAAAPERFYIAGMTYPKVALIKMRPNDIFGHLLFKPCIIRSVVVNYTGAPVPSFHKDGAPTVIGLTLNVQEMQFWFRSEIK